MQVRFTVPLPAATSRACVVCERPLDRQVALTPRKGAAASPNEFYSLCLQPDCRWVFQQVGDLPEAEFRRQLQWSAQRWRQSRADMRQAEERRERLVRERAEAEAHEAEAAFAAIGPRPDLGPPPEIRLVAPNGHARPRRLPERRRRAYAEHLDAVIAAAAEPAAPTAAVPVSTPDSSAAPDSQLPGRLCGACGGGCCVSGGTRAYLTEATIRRVMAAHPELGPAQLRALYLGHLAERTIPGSCVHHARDGCSLPRTLRSDVCNRYACTPLKSLLAALAADPPVRKVVVLRRRQGWWNHACPVLDNDIVGAAVLTETASTRIRPPKSVGGPPADAQPPASAT